MASNITKVFDRVNETCARNNMSVAEFMGLAMGMHSMRMRAAMMRREGRSDDEIIETLKPDAEKFTCELNNIRERRSLGET